MHKKNKKYSVIAGSMSLIGALVLISAWYIFLFAYSPTCFDSIELAIKSIKHALSPSIAGTWFFVYTIASIIISIITSIIFFVGRKKQYAMYIVVLHSLAALFTYTWSVTLAIAMPLFYFNKVIKNA